MNRRIRRFIGDFYLVLMLLFLYLPISMVIVLSFNESRSRTRWGGFTLRWYGELFLNVTIMRAFYNTLLIAFLSAPIATMLDTATVISLHAMKCTGRDLMIGLNNIPMLNVDIVTDISLMLTFIASRFTLGLHTVLISHIALNVPYILLSTLPKLKQTNRSAYEAVMDLGATPRQALFYTVFPDAMPGMLPGFLLTPTMSLDDFITTYFTKDAGIGTLSTLIYSQVWRDIVPSMHTLSTIIFAVALLPLLVANLTPPVKNSKQA